MPVLWINYIFDCSYGMALTVFNDRGAQGSACKRLTEYMYPTIPWVTQGFRPSSEAQSSHPASCDTEDQ